jgi:hypothetical protein
MLPSVKWKMAFMRIGQDMTDASSFGASSNQVTNPGTVAGVTRPTQKPGNGQEMAIKAKALWPWHHNQA